MSPALEVPEALKGRALIASVSGGKDSTAMVLALREAGIEHRCVFADTGWEADETYAYLAYLVDKLGIWIDRVEAKQVGKKPPGGMVERARYRAGFPMRSARWCTGELKIEPIRDYHAAHSERSAVVVGLRAQESAKRASLPELTSELEGPHSFGWPVWRPLISWSLEDVLAIHRRHGVKINPLYRRGHNRVGCYPCVYSVKDEIRLIAKHAPERIEEIRTLETEFSELRRTRNIEKPGRYGHERASFFSSRGAESRAGAGAAVGIDEVVAWSRTSRGGRQLPLIEPPPEGGCYRWGLCEAEHDS